MPENAEEHASYLKKLDLLKKALINTYLCSITNLLYLKTRNQSIK